jgi:multidrug efflux pump subunit AcrB
VTNGPGDGDDDEHGVEQDEAGGDDRTSEKAPSRPKPLVLAPKPRPRTKLTLVETSSPSAPQGKVVSLQAARTAQATTPKAAARAKQPPKPTIAQQLAAQRQRKKAQAEAERKANKKRRPKNGQSQRDALFRGFKEALEKASKEGGGFSPDDPASERPPVENRPAPKK